MVENEVVPNEYTKYQVENVAPGNGDAYAKGDKTCCFRSGASFDRFYIRDDSLWSLDATQFKNAVKGILVAYKKAE